MTDDNRKSLVYTVALWNKVSKKIENTTKEVSKSMQELIEKLEYLKKENFELHVSRKLEAEELKELFTKTHNILWNNSNFFSETNNVYEVNEEFYNQEKEMESCCLSFEGKFYLM